MPDWKTYGITDIGKHRAENQDRVAILRGGGMLCVADGMGGMEGGALAAQSVVDGVAAIELSGLTGDPLKEALLDALRRLNDTLNARWQRRSGATLALLLADGGDMLSVTSGDSEAFLFRDGELNAIGAPHNEFAKLLERGLVDPDDLHHPARSYLTAYMGMGGPWRYCAARTPARAGDLFFLCSDGISGMLTRGEMREILRAIPPGGTFARDAGDRLTAAALEAGGFDNTAVALAYAAPPQAALPRG